MSAITDVNCVLTQKALDAFCNKFHIPEEVRPILPNRNDTMHERPAKKIELYTRFFDFANFRLPLSTFLVDILRHFRINISQLSVIRAAKNDHFFWVDDFAFPASFPWHTAKHVTRDPAPMAADFNEQDYATLVAYPSSFQKFLEEFMCLVGLSRHYTLDEETYPRFLHKNREERNKGEPLLLETTVGRTVSLLPVSPDHAESELDASVERLFDEGGSGNQTEQGDFASGKRKYVVVDAGEASHPLKKLREDHETSSMTSIGGKSSSAVQRLLVGAVLNAEVGVAAIPTLPFMKTSISTTPEREGGDHTNSVAGLNLRATKALPRFVITSDSSHHSGTNVAEAEVNSLVRSSVPIMTTATVITSTVDPASVVEEKFVEPSLFCSGYSSVGGNDPTTGGLSDLTGSDFLVVGIRTMVDEFAPPKFFASVREMEHDQLFTEFNVKAACQMSLSVEAIRLCAEASNLEAVEKSLRDEMNTLKERNVILERERNALDVKAKELEASAAGRKRELTYLNSLIISVKSHSDSLVDRVHELEISSFGVQEKVTAYENCMGLLKKFQDDRMKVVNDKFDKLYTDFVEMALHLEEKFYPHLLTTISSRKWLLTHGMELAIVKEGRVLTDVAAHNPSTEVDYISALQQLQNVNFSLLAKLKSNKDASVETVMDILLLEDPLAEKLGLNELQPDVGQLMVPIHRSSDKVVLGATALSLALDVSNFRVQKIRENIANQRSAIRDVFVPLAEPFFAAVLTNDYEVVGANDQSVADGNATSFLNVDDAKLNILHDGNDKVIMWHQEPRFGLEFCLVDLKMISEPGDANRDITVTETFRLQTDDELSDKELKQIEADDQAIQTILLGSDIGIEEKKAKLFNKWERFTSNKGESIESYYHRFLKLMNDLKRNKHFSEKIATPHQDQPSFNQNYLQQPMTNPEDITDPTTVMNMALALMAKTFKLNYSTPTNNNQRISSKVRNRQIAQPGMNMGQDRQIQMVGGNGGNQFRQYAGQNARNTAGYNDVIENQVIHNVVQNPRVQNVENQNGLIGVQRNGD
nr:hypothetical protein [Tanacetum cinerariifolium]